MNELRTNMLATRKTNSILAHYGSSEGYSLDNVYTKPLYEALKAFYTENKTAVGHTITHESGILFIDGSAVVRFAHKDTLNTRLAKAAGEYYDAEYKILKAQEKYID